MAATQQHALQTSEQRKPSSRTNHSTLVVGETVYLWAGSDSTMPKTHDSEEKLKFLSRIEAFNVNTGSWEQRTTHGTPPLGVESYSCVAVKSDLYYFGGGCGHVGCYHNSIHALSTSTLQWRMLAPTTSGNGAPMMKHGCGMVHFTDEEEDLLFVVGGCGPSISSRQHGAEYQDGAGYVHTNEQHIFCLSTCEWSSLSVTGQVFPPCTFFTLTTVGEKKAALYGGWDELKRFNHLFIVELGRRSVHWSNICISHKVEWPQKRSGHAATHLSGSVFVMVGGQDQSLFILDDMWLCDTTNKLWKKIPVPDKSIDKPWTYSISAIQLGPHHILLILFASNTVTVELIQGEDGEWSVERTLRIDKLNDKAVYQNMLRERRIRKERLLPLEVSGEQEIHILELKEKIKDVPVSGSEVVEMEEHEPGSGGEDPSSLLQLTLADVIHAYDVSLRASKETEQQLQSQLATVEQELQDKKQQLSKLEDENYDLHKKMGIVKYENEQQQEELKRLQSMSMTYGPVQDKYDALTASYLKLKVASNEKQSVDTVETGVQADYLAVAPGFLRGVEVYGETVLEVVGDKPQKLEWPGYGFYMEVPDGALAPGVTASVGVKVTFSGQFKLPENSQLISAIYWISSSEIFLKEVAVNIQHFAVITSKKQCSQFSFIFAKSSQKELPYTFHKREGSFNPQTQYGTIMAKQFCLSGVIAPEDTELRFASLKFYKPKSSIVPIVDYAFVVVCDNGPFLKCIRKKYHNYEEDTQDQILVFDEDKVVLDLPAEDHPPKVVNDWKILPLTYPQISKADVQNFKSGRAPPACTIELEWIGSGEPKRFSHKVNIIGARKPNNYFYMRYFPQEYIAQPLPETRETFIKKIQLGATPTLLQLQTMKGAGSKPLKIIETVAAGDYMKFGMFLLQDENRDGVELIKNDHILEGAESVTLAILKKWLASGAAPTRTYQHLINCLERSGLDALAEDITDISTQT